jgi:hypothetical protein
MKSPHQNVLLNLPTDPAERKAIPIMTGVIDYFPAAIAEIAKISKLGNDQHNPGQPLHWAREKSTDQADTIIRHLMARGTRDTDGARHSAKAAWRALALLQEEIEAEEDFMTKPALNLELLEEVHKALTENKDWLKTPEGAAYCNLLHQTASVWPPGMGDPEEEEELSEPQKAFQKFVQESEENEN